MFRGDRTSVERFCAVAIGALLALGTSTVSADVSVRDDQGHVLVLPQPARRIISLVPSLTETVCAVGGCELLVGTDRHSRWPASVAALPKLGGLDDMPVERLLVLKPDLVLMSPASRAADRLRGLGVKVAVLEATTLADVRRGFDKVSSLIGMPERSAVAWQRVEDRLAAAAARVPRHLKRQRVYVEVASHPYAAGEASFIGELLALMALRNIVPGSMGPFPLLSPEFVVKADPDIVMAAQASLQEMPTRPGWARMRALVQHATCGFGPETYDTLVRPGPRLAEAAEAMADCLSRLGARAAP